MNYQELDLPHKEQPDQSIPCEHCRIGHSQQTAVPYIQWLNGQIVVMPDVPAASCDICGYMEYDAGFIQKLDHLLNQLSKPGSGSHAPPRKHLKTEANSWPATRRSQ
jgi:hypothetical protein